MVLWEFHGFLIESVCCPPALHRCAQTTTEPRPFIPPSGWSACLVFYDECASVLQMRPPWLLGLGFGSWELGLSATAKVQMYKCVSK